MGTRLLAGTSMNSMEKMWEDRPSTGEQVEELLSLQLHSVSAACKGNTFVSRC